MFDDPTHGQRANGNSTSRLVIMRTLCGGQQRMQ